MKTIIKLLFGFGILLGLTNSIQAQITNSVNPIAEFRTSDGDDELAYFDFTQIPLPVGDVNGDGVNEFVMHTTRQADFTTPDDLSDISDFSVIFNYDESGEITNYTIFRGLLHAAGDIDNDGFNETIRYEKGAGLQILEIQNFEILGETGNKAMSSNQFFSFAQKSAVDLTVIINVEELNDENDFNSWVSETKTGQDFDGDGIDDVAIVQEKFNGPRRTGVLHGSETDEYEYSQAPTPEDEIFTEIDVECGNFIGDTNLECVGLYTDIFSFERNINAYFLQYNPEERSFFEDIPTSTFQIVNRNFTDFKTTYLNSDQVAQLTDNPNIGGDANALLLIDEVFGASLEANLAAAHLGFFTPGVDEILANAVQIVLGADITLAGDQNNDNIEDFIIKPHVQGNPYIAFGDSDISDGFTETQPLACEGEGCPEVLSECSASGSLCEYQLDNNKNGSNGNFYLSIRNEDNGNTNENAVVGVTNNKAGVTYKLKVSLREPVELVNRNISDYQDRITQTQSSCNALIIRDEECSFYIYSERNMDVYVGGNTVSSSSTYEVENYRNLTEFDVDEEDSELDDISNTIGLVAIALRNPSNSIFQGQFDDLDGYALTVGALFLSNIDEDQVFQKSVVRNTIPLTIEELIDVRDFQDFDSTFSFSVNTEAIGDLDGDDEDEILIGSLGSYVSGGSFAPVNKVWLFYSDGDYSSPDLTLDLNTINGIAQNSPIRAGAKTSALGDINGDGMNDFAFSAPSYIVPNQTSNQGGIFVYFGQSRDTANYTNPDLILNLTVNPENNENFFDFGKSGMAVGDFDGDGFNDIAANADFQNGDLEPPVITVFKGGPDMDDIPDYFLDILGEDVGDTNPEDLDSENVIKTTARNILTFLPKEAGQTAQDLLWQPGSGRYPNAVIFSGGTNPSARPSISLVNPNSGSSFGASNLSDPAIGDFNNDGFYDIILTNEFDNNDAFTSSRSYLFSPNSGITISNEDDLEVAATFKLNQNYPNPFNPSTTISFQLPVRSQVTLKVYDLLGREVANLIDGESMASGVQSIRFDALGLASGIYIYRLTAGEVTLTNKMMLIK